MFLLAQSRTHLPTDSLLNLALGCGIGCHCSWIGICCRRIVHLRRLHIVQRRRQTRHSSSQHLLGHSRLHSWAECWVWLLCRTANCLAAAATAASSAIGAFLSLEATPSTASSAPLPCRLSAPPGLWGWQIPLQPVTAPLASTTPAH